MPRKKSTKKLTAKNINSVVSGIDALLAKANKVVAARKSAAVFA